MHDSVDDHNGRWDKRLPIGGTRRATNRSRPVRVAVVYLGPTILGRSWGASALLNEIDHPHDCWRRAQIDTQVLKYWDWISEKRVKSFLTFPDVEYLKPALFTEDGVQLHGFFGGSRFLKTPTPFGMPLRRHVLRGEVDRYYRHAP